MPTRDEVLYAYAVEPVHDRRTLERYLREHPQHGPELVDVSRSIDYLDAHRAAALESVHTTR